MNIAPINTLNPSTNAVRGYNVSSKGNMDSTLKQYDIRKDDMTKAVVVGGVCAGASLLFAIKDKSASKITRTVIGFVVAALVSQLTFMASNSYIKHKRQVKMKTSNG